MEEELKRELLEAVCTEAGIAPTLRRQAATGHVAWRTEQLQR